MKTLVLCVDRDDDIGVKTSVKGPLIGRDDNVAAAMKLGLADAEDSDVNALLGAIALYDDLVKQGMDAEIATITGDVRVGSISDLVLTQQLDRVIEEVRPDRAFLVSDGAEDEAFAPILGSRLRVDHVRRVFVRQTAGVQSLYYQFARQMRNPKVRRKVLAPLGFVLIAFGVISALFPFAAGAVILVLAGLYLLLIALPFSSIRDFLSRVSEYVDRAGRQVASGDLSIFFNLSALILVLVGVLFGIDIARSTTQGYVSQFLAFLAGALWWFVLAVLAFEGGKVVTAYFKHGRAPRHVLAVAGASVAVGLLVIGTVQTLRVALGALDPTPALPLIYLTIGLAITLVIVAGLSYRTPQEKPVEDGWRH